ncbi:hypothetical protein JHK85_014778 [Glycine max]|nr:hypothetical protein JHK85_014778 [Glycine max]
MDIAALLTSAGVNISVCLVIFSLYSVLRKQPSNVHVYFGRKVASRRSKSRDLCLERFVPSPTWVMKAWETTQDEMLTAEHRRKLRREIEDLKILVQRIICAQRTTLVQHKEVTWRSSIHESALRTTRTLSA